MEAGNKEMELNINGQTGIMLRTAFGDEQAGATINSPSESLAGFETQTMAGGYQHLSDRLSPRRSIVISDLFVELQKPPTSRQLCSMKTLKKSLPGFVFGAIWMITCALAMLTPAEYVWDSQSPQAIGFVIFIPLLRWIIYYLFLCYKFSTLNMCSLLYDDEGKISLIKDILGLNQAFINQYKNTIVYFGRISLFLTFMTDIIVFVTFFIIYYVPGIYGPNNNYYAQSLHQRWDNPTTQGYDFWMILKNTTNMHYIQTAYYGLCFCLIGSLSNQPLNDMIDIRVKTDLNVRKHMQNGSTLLENNASDANRHKKAEDDLIGGISAQRSLLCLTGMSETKKNAYKKLLCFKILKKPKSLTKTVIVQFIFGVLCVVYFVYLVGWEQTQSPDGVATQAFTRIFVGYTWLLQAYYGCLCLYNFIMLNDTLYCAGKSIENVINDVNFSNAQQCRDWWTKRERLINEETPKKLTYSVLSITTVLIALTITVYSVLARAIAGNWNFGLFGNVFLVPIFCMSLNFPFYLCAKSNFVVVLLLFLFFSFLFLC